MKTIQNISTVTAIALTILVEVTYASPTTTGGGGGASTPAPVSPMPTTAPPPDSLPIANYGILRAYAIRQVIGCSGSIWGEAMMYNSSSVTSLNFRPGTDTPIDEIVSNLDFANYHFKVTDKTKPLNAWGMLHNSEGMALFFGFAEASVSSTGDLISDGISLKMNSFIPIYVGSAAYSANIKQNGRQVMDLNVWNGYVFYPTDYTEEEATLVILWRDGLSEREVGYSAMSGSQIQLHHVSGYVGAILPDHWSYTDKYMLGQEILHVGIKGTVGDGHETPVASLNITTTRTVKFACAIDNGGSMEYPAYGWLFKKGSDTELLAVSLLPLQWSGAMILEQGQWVFCPETPLYKVPVGIPSFPQNR